MGSRRSRIDPDRLFAIHLRGTARDIIRGRGRMDEATAQLKQLAGGRVDLVNEIVGIAAGFWCGDPDWDPTPLLTAGLLLNAAGPFDYQQIKRWTHEGFRRATTPPHGTHDYPDPDHLRR